MSMGDGGIDSIGCYNHFPNLPVVMPVEIYGTLFYIPDLFL